MEHSEGRGGMAEVWVDGTLMTVCDSVSTSDNRCRPGLMQGVSFRFTRDEAIDWNDAVYANGHKKILMEPISGWSYAGYGRVESVMPVKINFGLMTMEDPEWSTDEGLVGHFVAVPISCLELIPAPDGDYPE